MNSHALCRRALRCGLLLAAALSALQVEAAFTAANAQPAGWTINWAQNNIGSAGIQFMPAATGPGTVGGGAGWSVTGGALQGAASGRINNGPGYIDVQAKVVPTKPTVAGALAKAMRKVGPLATGMALVDLAKDLGHIVSGSGDAIVYQKTDPSVCAVAPCYHWQWNHPINGSIIATNLQGQAAVCASMTSYFSGQGSCVYTSATQMGWAHSDGRVWPTIGTRLATTYPPASSPYLPSSEQEFIDSIALASGWPTSANFPKAVAQALESGEEIPGPVSVTGPATSQGARTTTTDAAGNVTQQQTVYNYTYNNNNVSYTTSTVTTVNGVTQSTTVKEGKEETDECQGKQTAGCADLDVPDGEIPKTDKTITYQAENLGLGTGTCPADVYLQSVQITQQVKIWDWQNACSKIATYVRPMVLTLASIAALLIVLNVKLGGTEA